MATHYEAEGQWIENRPYSKVGHWDINYSDILTQLIQSCGRYCKRYASDLFIDWQDVVRELEKGEPINETYIFGIRTDGVDHKSFYEQRKDSKSKYDWYHEVWELTIKSTEDGRWLNMELNLIAN